jgi:IS605 OrfB family transposase
MKQIIITRKVQIRLNESDAKLRKEQLHMIYRWRDLVRKGANMVVAHKFVQENVKDFVYIKDEIKEKFYVKQILKEGKGMSEQNTTYRVLSDIMKGQVPADIYSCLNQDVANTFKETKKDLYTGKSSLRSYKNNIPMPFSAKALSNLTWDKEDKNFNFSLFGVTFSTVLGIDKSGNKVIIDRCLDPDSEYKICSSKLQIDDRKKKTFLLLCVSIPKKDVKVNPDKQLVAALGIDTPIEAYIGEKAKRPVFIGNKQEYLHRRVQIQVALWRDQKNAKYNVGGKGRKRKLQSIEHWKRVEKNYIDTKIHQYSRMLVDLAVKHECGKIILSAHTQLSEEIKDNEFLLRNWTYHGLINKLQYKCNRYGIEIIKE